MEDHLALSIYAQYEQNHSLLSRPVSTLARLAGLKVDDVYDILLQELNSKDLGQAIKYAEVGIRYASIVDRNRLREECGEKFMLAFQMILNIVRSGLDSSEHWIKRKAMMLHGYLIDEIAEKQRFVDAFITEQKMEFIKEIHQNVKLLESEIVEFEMKNGGVFEVTEQPSMTVN